MNQAHDIDETHTMQHRCQMELTRILSGLKHEIPIFLFTRQVEKRGLQRCRPTGPAIFSAR
jgi:hypothetical protein